MDLEDNQRSYNKLAIINAKQEKLVRYHETRSQNLTIAYLLLHTGVYIIIISHRSSTSLFQCKNWWVPFAFSLSCSIIYFMTFLNTVNKFYWSQYYLDMNCLDQQVLHTRIRDAKFETKCQTTTSEQKPDPVVLFKRKLYISITVSALVAITVIQLYACRFLLCWNYVPLGCYRSIINNIYYTCKHQV